MFAEDQYAVGELSAGGEHEPFGVGVRPRTACRDLENRDVGSGEDRVERGGELSSSVADEESERFRAQVEVHVATVTINGTIGTDAGFTPDRSPTRSGRCTLSPPTNGR